jgi:hypothetical protein
MKKSILAYCLFSCFLLLAGCTAGFVSPRAPLMLSMYGPFRQVRAIYGSAVNGNGGAAITAGMMGPGNIRMRDMPGNQDIGKTVKKGIVGKKVIGNNGSR